MCLWRVQGICDWSMSSSTNEQTVNWVTSAFRPGCACKNTLYHLTIFFSDVVSDIIRNCEFRVLDRDSVIIKQGEKGDW